MNPLSEKVRLAKNQLGSEDGMWFHEAFIKSDVAEAVNKLKDMINEKESLDILEVIDEIFGNFENNANLEDHETDKQIAKNVVDNALRLAMKKKGCGKEDDVGYSPPLICGDGWWCPECKKLEKSEQESKP